MQTFMRCVAHMAFLASGIIFSFPIATNAESPSAPVGSLPDGVHGMLQDETSKLRSGDDIKVAFYERLDQENDKWRVGPNATIPRSFQEREELSGKYKVDENGFITLPMLGKFAAAGRTSETLKTDLSKAFDALVNRNGFVDILAVEHQPIYVMGPVKTPGHFKFEPGMTPLHAIALAGGLKQVETESWQGVESIKQIELLKTSLLKLKRLVARTEILRAARDARPLNISLGVGGHPAEDVIVQEQWQRKLVAMNDDAAKTAAKTDVENAQRELDAREMRSSATQDSIKIRTDRVKALRTLVDRNILSNPTLAQAQSELADASDRKQHADVDTEDARQKLAKAQLEFNKLTLNTRLELALSSGVSERDLTDTLAQGEGILDVMMTLADNRRLSDDDITFEIVRRVGSEVKIVSAAATDQLEPGDLIRVRSPASPTAP